MHEFSLCRSIGSTVAQHAAGREVEVVRVRIGHFRQVVPDTLAYCWELQVRDTPLAGARLEVDHVPAVIVCRDCGASTTLDMPVRSCGACGGVNTDLVSGEEFLVESIDVASHPAADRAAT